MVSEQINDGASTPVVRQAEAMQVDDVIVSISTLNYVSLLRLTGRRAGGQVTLQEVIRSDPTRIPIRGRGGGRRAARRAAPRALNDFAPHAPMNSISLRNDITSGPAVCFYTL
ncbi:hypothetical protein EVAR_35311_1 [Eumeta japonica]|uniref:Uncharacterized protein n=1 Tax=Eumeta variegata TaxID=151549 RepID=A0A4C1XHJ2_EUMVA|nr:hypothetical protein EVAR_35311_1 [Eumeta japonica]